MPQKQRHPLTNAALAQLNAELAAHQATVKSLASTLGMDYNTLRRYITGEREMPADVLVSALEAMHVPQAVFWDRAVDRLRSTPGA